MAHLIGGFRSTSKRPYTMLPDAQGRLHRHYLRNSAKAIKHLNQKIKLLEPIQTALINQMDFRKMSFGLDNKSGVNVIQYINKRPAIQKMFKISTTQTHLLQDSHKMSRGTLLDLIDNKITGYKKIKDGISND